MSDYTELKAKQEVQLANYKGKKLTVSDGKGNIVEQSDTRTFQGHYLECRKHLKSIFSDKYSEKYQQYKVDKARSRSLPSKHEQKEILDFDMEMMAHYNDVKQDLKAAKTIAALEAVFAKHKDKLNT